MNQAIKLTPTQQTILEAAAKRQDGSIHPLPERIKGAAVMKVMGSLKKKELIQDVGDENWRINDAGYQAIGQQPPTPIKRGNTPADIGIRAAKEEDRMRQELKKKETDPKPTTEPKSKKPKQKKQTKQARVIEMLKRPQGATLEQIVQETAWQNHTVRGFLSGTIKKRLGLNLTSQRTNKDEAGDQGAFSTYRIAET
ncbi:MAG: DUF3489 domain-containing protein [Magnetococcales bacterium]|nr:DUF3489 domain-containing protein [Magnetococcales bacterium]